MSQAAYIRDMMADPAPDLASGPSDVARFYAGRNVLLTGGCGFLGRLLTERILRSCGDVNKLFLFIRSKKGKSPEERFKELFDDLIFDRLKREKPNYARKVVLIEGDLIQDALGLSSEQREILRSTHIVIHGAATVRFDEKLRTATGINVRGTMELLLLAREMKNLEAFVHISTAYANCVYEQIEEKFYPPPIDCTKLLNLLNTLDDAALDHLTPVLLGKWPNTYTFTKAVAEDTIRQNCQGLPLCIVRPSIVIATAKEPVAGWINNVYGATGILVGAGVGLLRALHCDEDMVADMIPADYVVNNVITAAWDIAKTQSMNVNNEDCSRVPQVEPPIYNIVSSCQKPITWGQLCKLAEQYGMKIPSLTSMWHFYFKLIKNRWMYNVSVIFLHLLPAIIVDSLARLTGRKPMLWDAYKKIHKFSGVISYFTMRQWRFYNNNVLRLSKTLSPVDSREFDLDVGTLNWEDYTNHHVRGLRVYILKDPLDTIQQARDRYAKLKVAHYTIVTIYFGVLLWFLWTFLRLIGVW